MTTFAPIDFRVRGRACLLYATCAVVAMPCAYSQAEDARELLREAGEPPTQEPQLSDDEGFGVTSKDGSEQAVSLRTSTSTAEAGEASELPAATSGNADEDPPILFWSDGVDNRVPWDSYEAPRTKIGAWVHRGGGGTYCTGALVGNRVVLTAAHCMYNRRGERDDALFSAGHNQKPTPMGLFEVERVYRNNGYINQRCFDPAVRSWYCHARDFAVVVLERSPGLGSFGIAAAPDDAEFGRYYKITAGYPDDKGGRLFRDEPCHSGGVVRDGDYIAFAYACDIGNGQSGSPIWTPKHPRSAGNIIVGIATASGECIAPACRDRFASQGVRISLRLFEVVQEVKANHP